MSEIKGEFYLGGGGRRKEPLVTRTTGPVPDPGLRAVRFEDDGNDFNPDPGLKKGVAKRTRAQRRDPAPSKWAYRFQRIWLTPLFRALLRVGIPAFSVVFFVTIYLQDQENSDALILKIAEIRQSIEERPEFLVKLMAIDGASSDLSEDIREIIPIDFPVSSFHIDLAALQDTVEALDAVSSAEVRVRAGGVLEIAVDERKPAVIWRTRRGFDLLDPDGHLVAEASARSDANLLPLLAGDGANDHVREAIALYAAAAPLYARLKGIVRVGERRWDLVLDRDQRIMLPEIDPVTALEQVIALSTAQDLLERDLTIVDMRNASRPTIRLAQSAVVELRRIKGLELGVRSQ